MNEYYKVTVRVDYEADNGKIKKSNENYLVAAVSPTDAEAKITNHLLTSDMEVRSISKSNLLEVIE
jgi:hypothetical protein